MRKLLFLSVTALLSAPALAWVPQLESTTAKNVIDGAFGRRDPVVTYQTIDLSVKDGKFASGDVVKVFDGGDACLSDWLTNPADTSKGSRPNAITASGQADQLYFQAQDARDGLFKNLSAAEALSADYTAKRMADGELRIIVDIRGLPTEKTRDAYNVALQAPNGKLIMPVRKTYLKDSFKQDGATWNGTMVYYFRPLDAGLGASDKAQFLIRTEADTNCAYSITLDLGSFQ